jgi:hypothetical protein
MGLSGIYTPVRASGKSAEVWHLEWTFGSSGAVTLDTDQSDQDQRIAAPVADGGTGIVNLAFPKCNRVRVVGKNFDPNGPTTGTEYRIYEVTDVSASAGTAVVRFFDVLGDATPAAEDPVSGSRCSVTLLLDRT